LDLWRFPSFTTDIMGSTFHFVRNDLTATNILQKLRDDDTFKDVIFQCIDSDLSRPDSFPRAHKTLLSMALPGMNQLLGSDQAIAVNAEENTLNLLLDAVYDKEVKVEADDAQKLEALAIELGVESDLKKVGQSKPIVPPLSAAIIETADGKFQCILCGGTYNQR
jgi:hypothetical protein